MKNVNAHQCDFCGKLYLINKSCSRHEKNCYHNPITKSCITCAFFVTDKIPLRAGEYLEMKACLLNNDTSCKLKTKCPQHLKYENGKNSEILILARNFYNHDEASRRFFNSKPDLAKFGLEL
jgi:hypothetical protein